MACEHWWSRHTYKMDDGILKGTKVCKKCGATYSYENKKVTEAK